MCSFSLSSSAFFIVAVVVLFVCLFLAWFYFVPFLLLFFFSFTPSNKCLYDIHIFLATAVTCPLDRIAPIYTGSSFTYSWNETEVGLSKTNDCPQECKDLVDYPEGAALVRECVEVSGLGDWMSVNYTGCLLSRATLELCEANLMVGNAVVVIDVIRPFFDLIMHHVIHSHQSKQLRYIPIMYYTFVSTNCILACLHKYAHVPVL